MSAPPPASFLERLSVAPAADGLVAVTVLLPPDLVRDYCHFLESLAAFFESADRRIKIERAHVSAATQAAQKESGQRYRADYRVRLCASFDSYLAAGLDRKEAFKRVAADLRAVNQLVPYLGALNFLRSMLMVLFSLKSRFGKPSKATSTQFIFRHSPSSTPPRTPMTTLPHSTQIPHPDPVFRHYPSPAAEKDEIGVCLSIDRSI